MASRGRHDPHDLASLHHVAARDGRADGLKAASQASIAVIDGQDASIDDRASERHRARGWRPYLLFGRRHQINPAMPCCPTMRRRGVRPNHGQRCDGPQPPGANPRASHANSRVGLGLNRQQPATAAQHCKSDDNQDEK